MKKALIIVLSVCALAAAQDLPTIAVCVTGGGDSGRNSALGKALLGSLTESGRYKAIEQPKAFFDETAGDGGAVDYARVKDACGRHGAAFVCIATVTPTDGVNKVSAQVLDVGAWKIVNTANAESPLGTPAELGETAQRIAAAMYGGAAQPIPAAQPAPAAAVAVQTTTEPTPVPVDTAVAVTPAPAPQPVPVAAAEEPPAPEPPSVAVVEQPPPAPEPPSVAVVEQPVPAPKPAIAQDDGKQGIAVHVGIEVGYSDNYLNTSTGYRVFTEYKNLEGLLIGVPVLVTFNKYIAAGSGVRYVQKNYRYERDFQNGVHYEYSDYTNGFLQVPLFAQFSTPVYDNCLLYVDFGATLGGWLHSSRKGSWMAFSANPYDPEMVEMYDFDEKVEFDDTRDNRFESALFAGVGIKYTYKYVTPFVSVQYHYGLTDLQKDYMTNQVARFNNAMTAQFGVIFNINNLFGRSK